MVNIYNLLNFLESGDSTILQQNIQASNSFQKRENVLILPNFELITTLRKNTAKMGLKTISYGRPQLSNLLPNKIRN